MKPQAHILVIVGLLAVMPALGGCGGALTGSFLDGAHRTVVAEVARDTETARLANDRGLDHLDRGELAEAEKAFKLAVAADVEFGPAYNNLGMVYYKQRLWYAAAKTFEDAARLLPRHAEPQNNLGLVLEQAGHLDWAVDYYRRAVELDPENIVYRANLARTLVQRGDGTDELRTLLGQVQLQDARPEWRPWARRQLARLGPREK